MYSFMLIWIEPENAGNRGVLKFGPHIDAGMRGAGMGTGIASLLWSATQFCIINRPVPGEHLRESIKEIKAIINPPSIFNSIEEYLI